MILPVYDMDGIIAGHQIRNAGSHPDFKPRGVRVSECQPHIVRLLSTGMVLACEGPTDAIAVGKVSSFDAYSIFGCWSATTIPPKQWWIGLRPRGFSLVVACGDNDYSGRTFNQRLSNLLGQCYHLRWSPMLPVKMDVKQYLEEYGENSFERIVQRSIAAGPVEGSSLPKSEYENKFSGRKRGSFLSSGIISRIVESAGGRKAYDMAGAGSKWYCPLHEDRSDPSLTIDDETGSWKCWANCSRPSQGGPAQFIMAWKQCSYDDAINLLRKYV